MIFGIWTAIGVLAFLRQYLQDVERGAQVQLWPDLPLWLFCLYPAAVLSPFVFRLEKRVSQSESSHAKRATVLILTSVLVSYAGLWLETVLSFLGGILFGRYSPFSLRPLWGGVSLASIGVQEAFFWSTLGAGYVIRQLMESQEHRQESTRLALEKSVRFGDRLSVILDIAPPTEAAVVPAMLLQPLVENGIRHGLTGSHTAHGIITIRSAKVDGKLLLSVTDNGKGLQRSFQDLPAGVGLGTTKERLTLLYGNEHEFTAMKPEEGGTEVKIVLPFRTQNHARETFYEKCTHSGC